MFIPVGDTPNPKNFTPWLNWSLIGLNLLVYFFISYPLTQRGINPHDPNLHEYLRHLAPSLPRDVPVSYILRRLSAYDLYIFSHGYKAGAPQIEDLFYSLFLHGGLLHLGGNMLFLWIYGDNVEHRLGRLTYLFVYLACGIAATLFFTLFTPSSMTPLVGASGAISGILGLYFIFFPHNQVKVFFAFFPIFFNIVLLPARLVLGFYLLIDNLLPFIAAGSRGGIAYGAHIGGFLAGLIIAWISNRFPIRHPGQNFKKIFRSQTEPEQSPTLESLQQALNQGNRRLAFANLAALQPWQLRVLKVQETLLLATWLREAGHRDTASRLLRICLASHAQDPLRAQVYLALALIRLEEGQTTTAYQYLLDALDHNPDSQTTGLIQEALKKIDYYRQK